MPISSDEFRTIYAEKKRELTGKRASNSEIAENFRYYNSLVEFCGRDGKLLFGLDKSNSLTWEFEPIG